MLFFLLNKPKVETPLASSAEVYYSEVLPYFMTGYYQNVDDAKRDMNAMETYEKAFSLLSFIYLADFQTFYRF